MQISKTLLTCGAAALCLVATSLRAADSDTDQKLRDALHQKMAEVGPEEPAAKPAKVKAPKPTKAPKVEAPKAQAPKPQTPAAPAKPAPVAPAAVSKPTPPAPPVVKAAPAPAKPAAPAAPAATPEEERLREAVRARLSAQPPAEASTTSTPVKPTPVKPAPAPSAPASSAPTAETAPASPLSGSKEQRLSALLQKYKTDQITPQQYHEERMKIMSEK